jgi:signal transduction histidine kinase
VLVPGAEDRSGSRRRGLSVVTIGVFLVVAIASVAGFLVMRKAVEDQNLSILRTDTLQAASVIQGLISNIGGTVNAVSALAGANANASRTSIGPGSDEEIAKLATGFSVALVRPNPAGGYVVTYAKGPDYHVGEAPAPAVATVVAQSSAKLNGSKIFTVGGHPTIALVRGPVTAGLGAVVVQFPLDPYGGVATSATGPFSSLVGGVYAGNRQDLSQLVLATTKHLPVTGTTASAPATYQNVHWVVVAKARPGVSLVGSSSELSPYLILILGLFVGVLVAVTAEILVRRQRFAAEQVALRTAELETSLEDLRTAQEALVRNERLSAVGEMASVVGHELRNPLTAVTNSHYLLRQSLGDPAPAPIEKHLAMAERETAKAATLAEDLNAFVRPRDPSFAAVRLGDVVEEVVEATPPPDGVTLHVDASDGVIDADRGQIAEVLINLVTNAYQALPNGGAVTVSATAANGSASLVVTDDGDGVDPVAATRIFEPFYTTKATGTGLGLAIVRRLVEAHGGQVSLESAEPRGAKVVVRLPAHHGDRA